MVSSPTSVGDVLSLIGNAPVLHGNQTAIESLRAAKSTFPMFGGGDLSTMMTQMMSNPSSIMSNPMSAISGSLGGTLSGIMGQLTSFIGGNGLGTGALSSFTGDPATMLTSLTGLSTALGGLTALTGSLATPMGLLSLQAVYGIAQTLPGVIDAPSLFNPILAGPLMGQMIADTIVPLVSAGSTNAVDTYTAQMTSVVTQHQQAMARANGATMGIAGVGALVHALSSEGIYGDAIHAMLAPDTRDEILAHIASVQEMIENAKAAAAASGNQGKVIV